MIDSVPHNQGDLVKALILAGGFATRLRPLSCTRPKTLFPIVNKPLLQWIFERLSKDGVDEAILAVNALTKFYIKQTKIPKQGLKIKFSVDPPKKPLGTGGPIKKAEKLLGRSEPFIVLNGDIYAEIDYKKLLETHKKTKALATIALCKVEDPCSFGVVELEENKIKRFVEKPARGQAPSDLINAGAYVLNPEVFDYIPKGKHISIERDVFPKIVEQGRLSGLVIEGLWKDIGKPQEYLEANKAVLDTIENIRKEEKTCFKLNSPSALDKAVSIGEKSVIGPYAIVGRNVKIGKGVSISNSIILSDTEICDYATIKGAIIGEGACIGEYAKISNGCVVGDKVKIKDEVQLNEKTTVCPAKEINF